ncbi:histidine kinase, partial [Fischerella thermalis CCMEE 5273]
MQSRVIQQDDSPGDEPELREIYALYPIRYQGREHYLIARHRSTGRKQEYLRGEPLVSTVVGTIAFLLCYWLLTRKKMRQIRMISRGVGEIARGQLHTRVAVMGRDELASLASHINRMANQLEANRSREKQLEAERSQWIAHASHDLRTPLTSVIGYL